MKFLEDFIWNGKNQSARNLLIAVSEFQGHQGSVVRFSDNFLEISEILSMILTLLRDCFITNNYFYRRYGDVCYEEI